jgi:hypothetical protein
LGGERKQRYFYDVFFRALKHLLNNLREKGVALPSQAGFYEAVDEPPDTITKKIVRKTTPFPEHDFGMRRTAKEGISRKLILKGNLHKSAADSGEEKSQLANIIRYMNVPMKKTK